MGLELAGWSAMSSVLRLKWISVSTPAFKGMIKNLDDANFAPIPFIVPLSAQYPSRHTCAKKGLRLATSS
jgi:hypothetical protein